MPVPMSLLLRIPGAVEKGAIKSLSILKRAIGTTTCTPSWTLPPSFSQQSQERQRCSINSITTTRGRYGHGNCTSRGIHSYRLMQSKQQQLFISITTSSINANAAVVMNQNQNHHRNYVHRLSTTSTSTSTSTSTTTNGQEETNGSNDNNSPTIQMPDKDTELKLADLQATITEEYKRGDFTRALTSSQDLLKQTQQHFGYNIDHPATASAMNNVGLMQKLLGNFTEARQHYVAAMRIYASVCGRDHASYAMTLHNLGNLNKTQVHFDASLKATERLSLVEAAMDYLEEAYAIRIAELGAEHPHTVATRSAIGSTLAAQVLYQHKLVEDTTTNTNSVNSNSSSNTSTSTSTRKQYVALNPQGITQQQWRAAEEHLRASLKTAIDNPRGKQIQNNQSRKSSSNKKGKKKGKKQYVKQAQHSDSGSGSASSNIIITTLSAAAAAQNLAVFLKSLAMTIDEDSPHRKQHMYEAKDLYEKVQQVRTQLLPNDHPDLYATKYSLAELLDVFATTSSSGGGDDNDNDGNNEEQERQRHQEAANALRQEIIDTYDPPDLQEEKEDSTDLEQVAAAAAAAAPAAVEVIVEKTEASKSST